MCWQACRALHDNSGVDTQAIHQSLVRHLGQRESLTCPSLLANVACLSLILTDLNSGFHGDTGEESHEAAGTGHFASRLLQRLPNPIAAKFWYMTSEVFFMPLSQLKHLELIVKNHFSLDVLPFTAYFPVLETANIAAYRPCMVPELEFSGCRHLTRLVLVNIMVSRLSKAPQCRVSLEILAWHQNALYTTSTMSVASQLQPDFSEVNEVRLYDEDLYPSEFVAKVCWPKMEVIKCVWYNEDGCAENNDEYSSLADPLVHFLSKNGSNLPALKSIICADYDQPKPSVMNGRIPADLAGVQELIFATDRALRLFFDNACSAGERLHTFCAVASEVRVDPAALRDMNVALSRQGLTLSTAQAEPEHEYAPSQCMYLRAISAPELSYESAICAVNERVKKWGRHDECVCGACMDCLVDEGILELK